MKLSKVKEGIELFKGYLTSDEAWDKLFYYESVKNFTDKWDMSTEELSKMYLDATDNNTSRRLWRINDSHPRQVMSVLFHFEPVYVKFMFKDLFSEEISVDSRLERFVFHADQLFAQLEQHFIDGPYNTHYHDRMTASYYLAFYKPDKYLIYNWKLFSGFHPFLEMNNPPQHEDCVRYYKVCTILSNFLFKDEKVIELHKNRLNPSIHYTDKSAMLVYEFMEFISSLKN